MTRHALVVGINQYPFLQNTSTSPAKNLKTPAGDAEAIAHLLETYGDFRVERLPAIPIEGRKQVDPNPKKPLTKRELEEAIAKLFLSEDGRETALLFFAGHGLRDTLGGLTEVFLATSDACPRKDQWGMSLQRLRRILQKSPVQQQIIWLDCCFSGELLNFKDTELGEQGSGRDRFLIAASHSSEVAYQQLDGQHGVLSGALLKGLNPDRVLEGDWITNRTLSDFVDRELKAFYERAKISQTPQISTHGKTINLIKGINKELSTTQQTKPKESTTRKIPFVLPQLDVSTFTGRDEELSRLEELLLNCQGTKVCSIAGLAGVGGIGKSALACHFATVHKNDFPDGVIGLRVDGKDIDTIAREFARRCGEEIDSEDERDAATIMQEVFAHRRMLLIFDNAEDTSIRDLRPGGARCAVIITTRDRGLSISLNISNQGRINLSSLPDPDSLSLLEKLITQERVAAEPEAASDLIQLAGNLPLALQIIGAALKLNERRSLADYVASLSDERQRLARMRVRGDEHFDLKACFSLSLKQLQPEEIDFFACLSVCAEDGFSRQTAMAASGFDDEYTTQDNLEYLCRLSLLNYSEVGENRFVFHPLIRLFAHELLVERGLEEDATQRHAQFLINLVKSFNLNNRSSASLIGEEIDDIILAAEWLQQEEIADYEFAEYLNEFFEVYGYWSKATNLMLSFQSLAESREDWEAVVTFGTRRAKYLAKQDDLFTAEQVLEPLPDIISRIQTPKSRQRTEIKWLVRLGRIKQQQKLFDEAVDALQRGITISEELGEQESLRNVLDSLGNILHKQGKLNEAAATFQRVIEISEALEDKRSLAIELNCFARILQQQNKLNQALETFQRSIEISQALDYQRSVSIGFNGVGMVLQEQGKLDEALKAFERQVEISHTLDDQHSIAIGLNCLARVLQQQGKLDEALVSFKRRVKISHTLDDQRSVAIGLNVVGGILQQQGKLDEALEAFEDVVEISKAINDQQQVTFGLNGVGGILQKQNKLDEALEAFEYAVEIYKALDDQRQAVIGLNVIGGILQEQKKLNEALKAFEDVVEISRALDDQQQVAIGLNIIGGILQEQKKIDEALKAFKDVVEVSQAINDQRQKAIGLNGVGGILQKQNKLDEALEAFEQVVNIGQALGDQQQVGIGLNGMGCVLQKQGKLDEALEIFEHRVEISIVDSRKELDNYLRSLIGILRTLQQSFQTEGKFDEATQTVECIIKISQAYDDKPKLALGYYLLGKNLQQQGKLDEALKTFWRSVEISQALNYQQKVATGLKGVGKVLQQQGKLDEALKAFEDVVEISQAIDDQRQVTFGLNGIGNIRQKQDKLDEALKAFKQAVEIYKALGEWQQAVIGLNIVGGILQKQGTLDEALKAFESVVEISQALDDQQQVAIGLNIVGGILQQQGKLDEALKAFKDVVEISQALDNQRQVAFGLNGMGNVRQKQDKLDEALEAFKQVAIISYSLDDSQQETMALYRISGIVKQVNSHEAEMLLRRSYNLSEKIDDKPGQAIIFSSLGQLFSGQKDKNQLAIMYFKESVKLGEELNYQTHLARVYTAMGRTLLRHGNTQEAATKLVRGFEINENLRNLSGISKVTSDLTIALVELSRRNEALAYCQRALTVAPRNQNLQELYNKISSSQPIVNPNTLKQGSVKHIRYNTKQGCHWGHITPNDGSADIYFREGFIDSNCISQLKKGTLVEVEVKQTPKGLYARNIRIVDNFDLVTS